MKLLLQWNKEKKILNKKYCYHPKTTFSKWDYPKNVQVVFCPKKLCSFEPLMCVGFRYHESECWRSLPWIRVLAFVTMNQSVGVRYHESECWRSLPWIRVLVFVTMNQSVGANYELSFTSAKEEVSGFERKNMFSLPQIGCLISGFCIPWFELVYMSVKFF